MKSVADWQINHFDSIVKKGSIWKDSHAHWAWTNGTMYLGMVEQAKLSGDQKYWDFLTGIGKGQSWKPGPDVYHADDICVSQMYAEIFNHTGDSSILKPTIERMDYIISHPQTSTLNFTVKGNQNRWSWCDALFMAPTAYTRIGKITGDSRYYDFMDKEFWTTYDTLYNKKDSLFFRDTRYKTMKEANGKNIYWGRGNGWVIGGLTIIIDHLPDNYRSKGKYIALYKEMMKKIVSLQDENGFWHPSLLDYKTYPMPETSSSGFYTYGLAWGINRGYLDKKEYLPATKKGWNALVSEVEPNGKVGWVQAIGADPKKVSKNDTEVYGVGSFLMAASEYYKLLKR